MNKIAAKIDVTKIAKEHLFHGKKGVYLDCIFMHNRDGQSEYGDDGFIIQGVTKEKRDAGERGPIVGNWRYLSPAAATNQEAESTATDSEEIPF